MLRRNSLRTRGTDSSVVRRRSARRERALPRFAGACLGVTAGGCSWSASSRLMISRAATSKDAVEAGEASDALRVVFSERGGSRQIRLIRRVLHGNSLTWVRKRENGISDYLFHLLAALALSSAFQQCVA